MTPTYEPDYGDAINLVAPDGSLFADMSGPMVTGAKAVMMRVLARITTRSGSLFFATDVGENVLDLENTTLGDESFASFAAALAGEAEREQGVLSAQCTIKRDTIDARRVRVSLPMTINGRTVGLNLIVGPGDAAKVLFSGV